MDNKEKVKQNYNQSKDITALQTLGLLLRNRRLDLNYSIKNVADRSGLHYNYVSDVERGTRNLSFTTLIRLTQALDLPLKELFKNFDYDIHTDKD